MAIQINGNGTITGISVGGLPNGIVDTDMIAASAVTPAKSTITGGKILQVIESTSDTNVIATTSEATLLTLSITPSNASNKILISCNFVGEVSSGSSNGLAWVRVYRGTTSGTKIIHLGQGVLTYNYVTMNGQVLDSPNTTSAQTYTMTIARLSGGTAQVDTNGNDYYLHAMEVAA